MTLRDDWYKPNLLYNIHWRSPCRHDSDDLHTAAVVIKRFHPRRCTCHNDSPNIQYRMDSEIIKFTDEYEKLRKLNKIYTAYPDGNVKITMSTMKTVHKCITSNTELADTFVNDKLYVQGVKDLIGLFKAKRKSNDVDDFYVGIMDTAVDEQGDVDQFSVARKEVNACMCLDREDNCNVRDISHNVLTDEGTVGEETDYSYDDECDSDDESIANLFKENVLDYVEEDISVTNCTLKEPVDDPETGEISVTNMDKDAEEESPRISERESELIDIDIKCNLMFVNKIVDEISAKLKARPTDFTTCKEFDNRAFKQDEIFDDSFGILKVYCNG